jgi:redox-sensitive bicupin YhaK (pirin superfamily)
MTAGDGIAHAEQTPHENTGRLTVVQLWTALPDQHRHMRPAFSHIQAVPAIERPSGNVQIVAGELEGAASLAPYDSALLGADVQVRRQHEIVLPLDPVFEHAILVMSDDCALHGQLLEQRTLYYLGTARTDADFSSREGGRVLLIGGPPFPERILMWWNVVARTREEIMKAHDDWQEQRRFGEVKPYAGPRLDAPMLTRFAGANAVS